MVLGSAKDSKSSMSVMPHKERGHIYAGDGPVLLRLSKVVLVLILAKLQNVRQPTGGPCCFSFLSVSIFKRFFGKAET